MSPVQAICGIVCVALGFLRPSTAFAPAPIYRYPQTVRGPFQDQHQHLRADGALQHRRTVGKRDTRHRVWAEVTCAPPEEYELQQADLDVKRGPLEVGQDTRNQDLQTQSQNCNGHEVIGSGGSDGGKRGRLDGRQGLTFRRGSQYDNAPVQTRSRDGGYTAVLIVPTGIGASIGGYAGDALPVARAMSSVVDTLVTHPNVMNGAMLSAPQPGMEYVEGYALDEFCAGRWGLLPVKKGGHRIGLVLDSAIEDDLQLRHIQAANAARATLGINVAEYCVTEKPAGVSLEMTSGGASWGTVKGLASLVEAGRRLVEEAGCTAIAVVARFPDDEDEDALQAYREGQGVDAVGGAEAIISHAMTQKLKVPCAHAPALPPIDVDEAVSPRACAEELGYTFLPCVLSNLHRAPSLVTSRDDPRARDALWADSVDAVIAPATAFGGAGVLSLAEEATTLLLAVEDNTTVMKADAEALLSTGPSMDRCMTVSSYLEAVGVLAAHKAGVNPACLTSNIPGIRQTPPLQKAGQLKAVGVTENPLHLHAMAS